MSKKSSIPLNTNKPLNYGVRLKKMPFVHDEIIKAHRDDHCVFILQKAGDTGTEIDFKDYDITGAALGFIMPGQVHRYLFRKESDGWFVFIDFSLIKKAYRDIFSDFQNICQVVVTEERDLIFGIVELLENVIHDVTNVLVPSLIASITDALAGMIASKIIQEKNVSYSANKHQFQITKDYKLLIKEKYKNSKQVFEYANCLNITPLYLNEVIKKITGYPASYWIQQEIILEAKRLLYYSSLDIKQIAYELGYEDNAYFSRFFKRKTGITPVEFRTKNHYLSNDNH